MTGRTKRRSGSAYRNPFRTASYRRAMDAADDDFYAAQARKRAEAEAGAAAGAQEQTEHQDQGEKTNG